MSLISRINAFLTEKKDRTTYQNADDEQRMNMRYAANRRREADSHEKWYRNRLKAGYPETNHREHSALVVNARAIRAVAPDMPMAHVYRAAKAGLHGHSDIKRFAEAGVPAKSIAGPLWKMHTPADPDMRAAIPGGDEDHRAASHYTFTVTPPTSPQDALDIRRHKAYEQIRDGHKFVSLHDVRRTLKMNMGRHLREAGVNYDDAGVIEDYDGTSHAYFSEALQKHLDKLPAEPSVADLRKAVKPHLDEIRQRTLVEAQGQLERGLPHFDEVALHPLKGLPAGYREATHEDAPALAKWCVKSNACLARSVSGEFGDDHKPHRVVMSPEGHVVGLRRKTDGSGNELNAYHVPYTSMCCDKNNAHAPEEFEKFKGDSIKHMEEPDIEQYHGKLHRAGRVPRAWAMKSLSKHGRKPSKTYDVEESRTLQ